MALIFSSKIGLHRCQCEFYDLAKNEDLLLFFDEVQCGVGRTGKFLATDWIEELEPNIVSIAKGIGGGFPIGALLVDKKVSDVMTQGTHGSTFGGNPLAMAVAEVVLNYVLIKLVEIKLCVLNIRVKFGKKVEKV